MSGARLLTWGPISGQDAGADADPADDSGCSVGAMDMSSRRGGVTCETCEAGEERQVSMVSATRTRNVGMSVLAARVQCIQNSIF